MENEPSQTNRSVIFGLGGLVIGLVIGLVVLGWWLFPVQWVDFSPEQLGPADQEVYLRMAIDSLSQQYDTAAAISRYQDLGNDGPDILATIQANPEPQREMAVQAFTALVQAQPETAAQTGSSVWSTALIVLLLLLLLALLGYVVFRLLRRKPAPAETRVFAEEFPPEQNQPEEIMDMEAATPDEEPGVLMAETGVEVFGAPETEIEVTEYEDEGDGMGSLAGAGMVVAAATAAVLSSDEPVEPAPETESEAIVPVEEAVETLEVEGDSGASLAAAGMMAAADRLSDSETSGVDETSAATGMDTEPEEAVITGVAAKIPTGLEYIEGIGPTYAQKLIEIGVNTPEQLLHWGANPRGRQAIAERSEISGKLILKWVNQIDLYRVKGIGSEYAELLEQAGVDTVVELATRNPSNLYQTLVAVNEAKNLVRKLPVLSQVEDWVNQAKDLPRVVSY